MFPLIIAAIFEILEVVALAMTVNDLLSLLEDLFEGYQKFASDTQKAKQEIKRIIDKLKEEIAGKVEEKEEVAVLIGLSSIDPQRKETRQASGRGAGSAVINAAIEQKIPFRRVISMVCDTANKLPLPTLRKKKGFTVADLKGIKQKALLDLLRMTAEELAQAELETLIVVRLRQLVTSLLFEFIDSLLEWKSPMKAEVSFGPQTQYEDHPLAAGSATRLRRDGAQVNPFYPSPFQRRKGSIAADLVITEYRKHRCDKNNIFAIVEIKFQGDKIDDEQFQDYRKLLKSAATVKTSKSPVRHQQSPVNSGGRLSLFRYPEDRAADKGDGKPDGTTESKKPAPKKRK